MSIDSSEIRGARRWTDAVFGAARRGRREGRLVVGVLPGEGIGPEVVGAALEVLAAAGSAGADFEIRTGGAIGREAELMTGRTLTEEVAAFCEGSSPTAARFSAGRAGGASCTTCAAGSTSSASSRP